VAEAQGLDLRFRETGLGVDSDAALIEQICVNLVTHALRYTRTGGILVAVRKRARRADHPQAAASGAAARVVELPAGRRREPLGGVNSGVETPCNRLQNEAPACATNIGGSTYPRIRYPCCIRVWDESAWSLSSFA
jgi:signal transduction histidine kinase